MPSPHVRRVRARFGPASSSVHSSRPTAGDRAAEAETVLWEDLKRNPEHGWTLALLSKALKRLGKSDEAALIDARFRKSWKGADLTLNTSVRE